ncbi:unnamed protein product [Candida verbasci]|uniref:Acyl-CoA desaturase n=1 Tax=Candida verbasci TaxID=1227364 RepID=A0A9W4TYK4_9ASCO|nr:unnamed protein product [Candida verbasci]
MDNTVINNNGQLKARIQKRKVVSNNTQSTSISNSTSNFINQASKLKNTRINEIKKQKQDFITRINYNHLLTTVMLPLITLVYIFYKKESIVPENQSTLYFLCVYYNFTLLSFTAGYHKYFSHNSFKTSWSLLKYYFAIFGSSCGLGSIRWWASLHRAHHHFTDDTEKDPYSIKRGLIFSHYGWLLKKPKIDKFYKDFIESEFPLNSLDLSDDEQNLNHFLLWQQKTYLIWFFITSIILPALITKYICYDTFIHGIIYPGILRMFLCQQSLLSTESLCHLKKIQVLIPTQPFNDKNSSQNCNNPLISFLTYGQSHQNYHHEFPHDYRCDDSYLTYDPTKWFLYTLEQFGLIDEVCRTPNNLVVQLKLQQQQHTINRIKSQLNWGTPISKLPKIKPSDFKRIISNSKNKDRLYIVIQNIIHDITPFMDQHPGGIQLLKASHGKDATKAFYGGVYGHSTAAINLLATMRIGILDNGNEEEVWKRVFKEEGELDDTNNSRNNQGQQYSTAEAA